jgi:hypothetical protein
MRMQREAGSKIRSCVSMAGLNAPLARPADPTCVILVLLWCRQRRAGGYMRTLVDSDGDAGECPADVDCKRGHALEFLLIDPSHLRFSAFPV